MSTATIHVSTTRGVVGAHFSQYHGIRFIPIPVPTDKEGGYVTIPIPAGSSYTKLAGRDDDRPPHVTTGNPWNQTLNIPDSGTYILDLSDWDDDPNASVELQINGATVWKAHGDQDNYDRWAIVTRARNVRITDDREIAVDIG